MFALLLTTDVKASNTKDTTVSGFYANELLELQFNNPEDFQNKCKKRLQSASIDVEILNNILIETEKKSEFLIQYLKDQIASEQNSNSSNILSSSLNEAQQKSKLLIEFLKNAIELEKQKKPEAKLEEAVKVLLSYLDNKDTIEQNVEQYLAKNNIHECAMLQEIRTEIKLSNIGLSPCLEDIQPQYKILLNLLTEKINSLQEEDGIFYVHPLLNCLSLDNTENNQKNFDDYIEKQNIDKEKLEKILKRTREMENSALSDRGKQIFLILIDLLSKKIQQ